MRWTRDLFSHHRITKQRINVTFLSKNNNFDHKRSPFQPSHWPAFTVQEDRAAALTEGLADRGQAEGGGESVRVRAHGAVPTHFVRQLTGALVALFPCRGQLLLMRGGIRSCLAHQAVALCRGAAGNVPLLILIFLLGCWVTGVGSGGDVLCILMIIMHFIRNVFNVSVSIHTLTAFL